VDATKGSVEQTENKIIVRPPSPKNDDWKFSRALHRSGLGLIALMASAEEALNPIFHKVRQYIRNPINRDVWPYLQRITNEKLIVRSIPSKIAENGIVFVPMFTPNNDQGIFYFDLFVDEFIVSPTGNLEKLQQQPQLFAGMLDFAMSPHRKTSTSVWRLQPGNHEW
jgi:hypothetical protein